MTHPILSLQAVLLAALAADGPLAALIDSELIFDAPPAQGQPPYVAIARHDVLPRDGDAAPGWEHRIVLHAWAAEASRKAVLGIADRLVAVALEADLDDALVVTHRRHERTDTAIDRTTGFARAAVALTFFTEPTEI